MGTIRCSVCSEPWDAYGVFHGDMLNWQAELFKTGAGCPCCEGTPPEGVDPEESRFSQARDIILGGAWDDPHAFSSVNELGLEVKRPEWKRPEDPVVFTCEQCSGEIRRNIEETLEIFHEERCPPKMIGLYWQGGRYKEMYSHGSEWNQCLLDCVEQTSHGTLDKCIFGGRASRTFTAKLKTKAPEQWTLNDKFYCPGCVENCGDCNTLCFNEELVLPEGKIRPGDAVCEECIGKYDNDDEEDQDSSTEDEDEEV